MVLNKLFIILQKKLKGITMRKLLLMTIFFIGSNLVNGQSQPKLMCGTDIILQDQIINNPQTAIGIKNFEKGFAEFKKTYKPENYMVSAGSKKAGIPKFIIPVVVHVIHANGSENISDALINSTISEMNQYFAGTIPGIGGVRNVFKGVIADCEIQFRLAKKDPNGNCTNGIVRVYSPLTNRGNEMIKDLSSWDTKRYLNIWVCNSVIGSGNQVVGGYSFMPFGGGLASKDGILVVASGFISNNTGAHEAGHWLGLYHPFDNSENDSCSSIKNDEIDDTPPTYFVRSAGSSNSGRGYHCNDTAYNTCPGDKPDLPDQQENVMDYFEGSCTSIMFTLQQKARMFYCIGNFRKQLFSADNLIATGVNDLTPSPCAPIAAFDTKYQTICENGSVTFTDYSYNSPSITSWNWEFPGGNPSTATGKVPGAVIYAAKGSYPVKLTVTNSIGSHTVTYDNYITVLPGSGNLNPGWATFADWWYENNWAAKGWRFENNFSSNKFVRSSVSYKNNASMMLPQDPYNRYYSLRSDFSFISPSFNFSNATSPYVAFAFSFARGPGFYNSSTSKYDPSSETLNLYTSTDCGKTWILRAAKSGANVSTIGDVQLSTSTNYVPSDKSKWTEVIFNGASFPKTANVMFRISLNYEGGNNFYLDNVRVGDGAVNGLSNDLASEINFFLNPNPFNTVTTLSYNLPQSEKVKITLFDILGKETITLFNGQQNSGAQNILIDKFANNLNSGMYIVQMEVGNSRLTHKIVLE